MFKINKQLIFLRGRLLLKGFLSFLFSLFSFLGWAGDQCGDEFSLPETLQRTRFLAELEVKTQGKGDDLFHPTHTNLNEDITREASWNIEVKSPSVIQFLLPHDVWQIRHRLPYSSSPTHVQITEEANAVIARAKWTHRNKILTSNIVFSKNALHGNIVQLKKTMGVSKKWLAREDARAVILFLHGGGTRTTSSSVANQFLNHFAHSGIDLVALDLPMHAGGPRQFLGIKEDILAFGSFAKKFIPPHVPVFVYGHSWGAVYADELMRMTDQYKDADFFHPSLKGLIIASPAMDAAPGRPINEKIEEYIERNQKARELAVDKAPPSENRIFEELIRKGKLSPLGGFYATYTLNVRDQIIPEHKGKKWMPSLMIMGKGDPLVYLGYEDLVHNYYDTLENVDAHYVDQVYDLFTWEKVTGGHLLSDYVETLGEEAGKGKTLPVNIKLIEEYIVERLGISKSDLVHQELDRGQYATLGDIGMLELNNLAFRNWRKNFKTTRSLKLEKEIKKIRNQNRQQFQQLKKLIIEKLPINQFFESLKRMSLVSSRKDFEEIQETLKSLEPYYEASFTKQYGDLFKTALKLNTWPEAVQFAREQLLQSHFHRPLEGSVTESVHHYFKQQDEQKLKNYLDNFPFKSRQGEKSVFHIPDKAKEKILNLWRTYMDADLTVRNQMNHLKGEVINTIVFYAPKNVLHNLLVGLSQGIPSKDLQKIKQELKQYNEYFNTVKSNPFYEELGERVRSLLQLKNFKEFYQSAAALVEQFPSLPPYKRVVTNDAIYALEQNLNEEDFVNHFKKYFLTEEALDSISQWYQMKQKGNNRESSLKNLVSLILNNSLIEHHFHLINFLRKLTYRHNLEQVKEFFVKEKEKSSQYIVNIDSILDASQKKVRERIQEAFLELFLKPSLAGHLEKQIEKLLSIREKRSGKLEHFLIQSIAFPRDIREEINSAYAEYNRIDQYISTAHIPESIDMFYSYYGDVESNEQNRHYSDLIEEIKKYVRQYTGMSAKIEELTHRQAKLLTAVRKMDENLAGYIRQVKELFNKAEEFLSREEPEVYKELQQKFDTMMNSHLEFLEMVDRLVVSAGNEQGQIETAEVIKQFEEEEFKAMMEQVEHSYSTWKDLYWKINNDLVPRVLKGELGEQYQRAFKFIYGESAEDLTPVYGYSQYLQLEDDLKGLAEVDSELIKAQEERDKAITEYHRIYPAQALSMPIRVNVQNLLSYSPDGAAAESPSYAMDMIEYIESKTDEFNMVLRYWKNMKGRLPKALPSKAD